MPAAHESFHRINGSRWVGDPLVAGRVANQCLVFLGKSHDAGGQAISLGIRDDCRLPALDNGHNGIGGSEVDSDNFFSLSHGLSFQVLCFLLRIFYYLGLNNHYVSKERANCRFYARTRQYCDFASFFRRYNPT